jgi:hypothetical protein
MNIAGQEVYPGRPCSHSTGSGCDDYANRPLDPCVNFRCGWVLTGSPLPEWMRPDRAKVIVLFAQLSWNGLAVDLAVPVGRRIPPRSLQWLKGLAYRSGRPLVYLEQEAQGAGYSKRQRLFGFGPQEFLDQLAAWEREGARLW